MTTHPCYIPNGRVIIFNFPAGAGGKMLQNCVGLSRYCVLTKLEYALWQMEYAGPIGDEFYQQKLQWILTTLPEPSEMRSWLGYELGETLLYGQNFVEFNKELPIKEPAIYQLAEKGLWSTLTVHNFGSVDHYVKYWSIIRHVCLTNSEQFARKNLVIKNTNLNFDEDWPTLGRTPVGRGFDFDIDSTIYNQEKFIAQVGQLYEYLEFDDFRPDLITEYYLRYIQLHL
jgi:hypothetical protein